MEVLFYPLTVEYKIIKDKALIYIYGTTTKGQQICVVDDSFDPFFYITADENTDLNKLSDEIKKLKHDNYFVKDVKQVKKNLREKETYALKVIVNLPYGISAITKLIRDWPGVHTFEFDIKFVRSYLVEKGIFPLTLTEAKGEEFQEHSRVPLLKATSIQAVSEETLKPRVLAFDIETYHPKGSHKIDPINNPILMLAVYGDDFKRIVTWKNISGDNIEVVKSEADMIARFKELLAEYKPDILTGYFSDGFDFPYIQTRAKKYKIKLDIGLDFSEMKMEGRDIKYCRTVGFVHLDILKFIRRVISRSLKTDTYSLDAVSAELLGEKKIDVDIDTLAESWDNNKTEELSKFAKYNLKDSELTYKLCNKLLPNMIELVKITGLSLFNVTRMGFSQLIEWFIIRRAKEANEIFLNKPNFKELAIRNSRRFKGAFVFEPKPGFYHNISVFDFRSLYPSIMASHNISIGTLNCKCCKDSAKKVPIESGEEYWFCKNKKGFISKIIEDLISRRSRVKELLKQNKKDKIADPLLDARSDALKVLANAFYGYLGFSQARWYCYEGGQSVTAYGRHYIHKVIDEATSTGFKVIYGDTDSIFLILEDKTKEDAEKFVSKINEELPGLMELEFESFYPSGLFVGAKMGEGGAKKKYAMLDEFGDLKIRGFETVRRNWSFIAKEIQKKVLEIILRENDYEKAFKYVKEIILDLRAHKVDVKKLAIRTKLTKFIEEYDSIGPHVAAAKIMKAKGFTIEPGMIMTYVICKNKSKKIRDKVKLVEDVTNEDYDPEYYINNQIIPSVDKIFVAIGKDSEELHAIGKQSKLSGFF